MSLDWMDDALCAEVGTEPFFPLPGENPHQAVAVCQRCPVQTECLDYAHRLDAAGPWTVTGIWGGTSANQRHRAA